MSIEVTEDAEDKRRKYFAEVLSRRGAGDRSRLINADPSKHYRFRKAVTPQELERYSHEGFTASKPESGVSGVATSVSPDNTIRLKGDLVLMEEDRELFEAKKAQDIEKAQERMKSQREKARDDIERYARDNGLSQAHRDVTFERTTEGTESQVVRRKRLPS